MFGGDPTKKGMNVQSNSEWDDHYNAFANMFFGNNGFNLSDVDYQGTHIDNDAFQFPHMAQIEYGNEIATIGPDRGEDFYPYKDAIAVPKITMVDTWELVSGEFAWFGQSDTNTSTVSVIFDTASTIAPVKHTSYDDAAIVGYQWQLVATITDVSFSDDNDRMFVTYEWAAGANFDTDSQADLYSVDTDGNSGAWAPSAEDDATYETISTLINDWLTAQGEDNVYINGDSDFDVYDKLVRIPIAQYQWDYTQDRIERVVQLYFGGAAPFSMGDERTPNSGIFQHPFQGAVTDVQSITIGGRRSNADYQFEDSITVTDPDTDQKVKIDFATPETIFIGTSDAYVYYDIYKYSSGWVADLEKSSVWPPTATNPGNICKLIGFAGSTNNGSTDTLLWGQEMFDCPNEQPASIRGEFEPYYENDGDVTIAAGTVETYAGDSQNVGEGSFSLSTPVDIWVEAYSTASNGSPDVTISGSLQSGTYPGLYSSESDSVKVFAWKIGEVTAAGIYEPSHKGRLEVDNTLLQPLIGDSYETLVNAPRMMEFHTSQPVTVGDTSNDDLLNAKLLNVQVRGGTVHQMAESSDVRFYGVTTGGIFNHVWNIDTNSTDEVIFQRQQQSYDFERGLAQEFEEGEQIADAFISALDWVGIEKGGTIYHKRSPAIDDSTKRWFSTGTLQIAGSTDTIELFFDNKGHLWQYNSSTQPPPDENYLYRHCTDPSNNVDLIFSSQQANTVILVDDECYSYVGTTERIVTSPTPTVSNTYSSCEGCESALTKEYWKKCADDTDVAVLSDTHTDVDYAWLCISSAWVKCYYDRPTADTATDPTVLKQCGVATPTSCADLVGWPASDDFGGVGCNSGSVGDTNWGVRFERQSSNGTIAISGGSLNIDMAGAEPDKQDWVYATISRSGDFLCTLDYALNSFSNADQQWVGLRLTIGGNAYGIYRVYRSAQGNEYRIQKAGALTDAISTSETSQTLEISRSGSTITFKNGSNVITTASESGTLTRVDIYWRADGGDIDVDVDNLVVEDGASGDILIDPTGESCT